MPESEGRAGGANLASWAMALGGVFLLVSASVWLLWLLVRWVPMQAAVFAEAGVALPLVTRVVIETSRWTIRLLPLLIIGGLPALGLSLGVGLAGAERRGALRGAVRAAALLTSAVALLEIIVGLIVLWSLHLPLEPRAPAAVVTGTPLRVEILEKTADAGPAILTAGTGRRRTNSGAPAA